MAYAPSSPLDATAGLRRDRVVVAAIVAAVHLALGYLLLSGLAVTMPVKVEHGLTLLDILPPKSTPPKPRVAHRAARAPRKQGAAAPPNLRSHATEVVAPPPVVPIPVPPPVVAAPVANDGGQASQGAAPRVGPGTGAGGQGNGTGSGDEGDGDGGGGGGRPLQLIGGWLRWQKLPRDLWDGLHGTVSMRFIVGVDGRATDCRVTRSSGNAALDTATCDQIERRLRYRPELDRNGRKIAVEVIGTQIWSSMEGPDEPDAVESD